MYLFIEKRLRGGISYILETQSEANNKYIKDYDPTNLSQFITYLDIINLYGLVMSNYLLYSGFKCFKNSDNFRVNLIGRKSSIGCIFEVALKYSHELYVLRNDYPLAPEKIPYDMLSDYCKKIADKYEIKVGDVKNLISNLANKTKYALHYRNLQLYLSVVFDKNSQSVKF